MTKKIGLWNPYLDIVGGGEKHILQICNYFVQKGYDLTIFWDEDIRSQLDKKLTVKLPINVKWMPKLSSFSFFQKFKLLRQFDVFVYVTDGSYFFSTAKKTISFCMVPDRNLYHMNWKNKLMTRGWDWICNSEFTRHHLDNWGVDTKVVYPAIDIPTVAHKANSGTTLTFLTVGRFFKHLHSKRHDAAVAWFVHFITQFPQFSASKLVLVGGLKDEDKPYYESLKKLSTNYPNVVFKTNVASSELEKLYVRSDYYIHFAGWQVSESRHPERTEHLGITPIEAMSYGCIPFCYLSGGIREVVKDYTNGFTFQTLNELSKKILDVNKDIPLQDAIRYAGRKTAVDTFSTDALTKRMDTLYSHLV